jgi:hypothetical protein
MPRGAYNQTAEVRHGPGSATPGAIRMVVACRLVQDDRPLLYQPAVFRPTHYVNWTGAQTSAGTAISTPPTVTWDSSTADVWEIPQGSGVLFTVLRRCVIRPRRTTLPFYNRAWLVG